MKVTFALPAPGAVLSRAAPAAARRRAGSAGFLLLVLASRGTAAILPGVHPGFDLVDMRPATWQPKGIGGMDWLPDGRLAVAIWGGNRNSAPQVAQGEIQIVTGAMGKAADVAVETIATGLSEPMGLAVVEGEIYVAERSFPVPRIARFSFRGGKWEASEAYSGWGLGETYRWHMFSFGLRQVDGFLWFITGSNLYQRGGPDRGSLLKVDLAARRHAVIAGGLRTPNGLGVGPEYSFWTPDNEGDWLPHNKMIHLQAGRWYGHAPFDYPRAQWPDGNGPASLDYPDRREWAAAAQVTHDNNGSGLGSGRESGRSPTEPLYLTSGPYAGQFLAGDIHRGGLQRYFLEKVGGEWQAALFDFTQGLECGVNRLILGRDGKSILMGGAGSGPPGTLSQNFYYFSWGWKDKWYGFQKLVPNGKAVFEMRALRSLGARGFEIEFTAPVGPEAAGAAAYQVRSHAWQPARGYGAGRFREERTHAVTAARVSADGRRVALEMEGLAAGRVVHIRLAGLRSRAGEAPWTPDAWYTLNAFGPGADPGPNLPDRAEGRDGISLGNPQVTEASIPAGGAVRQGRVLRFDGVDDEIHATRLVLAGDFTVSAWVNLEGAAAGEQGVAGIKPEGPGLLFRDGRLRLGLPGGAAAAEADGAVPAGRWIHIAAVRAGAAVSLHVDGRQAGSGTWDGRLALEYLGAASGARLRGLLDEFRVYGRALSAAELAALHRFEGPSPGLLRHWRIGEATVASGLLQAGGPSHPAVAVGPNLTFRLEGLPVAAVPRFSMRDLGGRRAAGRLEARREGGAWRVAWRDHGNATGVFVLRAESEGRILGSWPFSAGAGGTGGMR